MNSNNNNQNHEIAVYQHFNGRFAHSSVLFRLTCLLAWNSSDCFESFSPLNNVWIDGPLMPSSDVTHYPKTG